MIIHSVFGRNVGIVPLEGLMESDDTVAEFFQCADQDFDIIFFDPAYGNTQQAIMHELLHAVIDRLCLHQTSLSKDIEEILCDGIANFLTENYQLTPKVYTKK